MTVIAQPTSAPDCHYAAATWQPVTGIVNINPPQRRIKVSEIDIRKQGHQRIMHDKLEIPTLLLEKQHKLNLEIIQKQHSLNLEIHKKQSKLLKWSIVATVLAALLGATLGQFLPSIEKYLTQEQKPINSEKTSQ